MSKLMTCVGAVALGAHGMRMKQEKLGVQGEEESKIWFQKKADESNRDNSKQNLKNNRHLEKLKLKIMNFQR